jgi:hypothetical protein
MKNRNCLQILLKSTIAAALLVESAFADVNGHLLVESSGIKAVDRQLDVSFTENGEVRIAWDTESMSNAILQVSTNCVDWTEVSNASSPFFTPFNNEVSTYYRVVYALAGDDTPAGPEDPEDAGGVIVGTPADEVDGEPGPDMSWADRNGDGLLDAKDLEGIPGGPDDLMNAIVAMQGAEAKSVPAPIEWLEEILDRLNQSQGEDEPGNRVGMIVSVNPAVDVDTFRNRLEHGPGLHDSIHCIVGGTMCSARSSNDPIFFTHHANLDEIVEGEKQHLLIALVNFPDDLSGIVSTMLHDTGMAVIRKMGGEVNDGDNDSGQDGYPVLIHGIAAADSPIEGFWIAPSVEVSALAGAIASTSLHNNGAFLPWHRGISLHNNGAFLPWHRGISLHNNGAFLPWHRAHITFPDDLGPPGGALQENRDPVPALITGIWTKSSGTRLADDLDLLLNHLWHDAIPEGDDINGGENPARMLMLDTGPISLSSRDPEKKAGLDVGPVNLVMQDGAGNAIGREGAVYIFHRENDDDNLSERIHDTAMAVIRKIGAAPEGGGGRVVVRAASLQNDPGSDSVQGVVVEIDKPSPKIAHQVLSGDDDSGDDIGMVLLEIDKSSTKIAEAILKAGESLAAEHFVVILDTTPTDGEEPALPMAFAGPAVWLQSRLGIGSEHWPEPALEGEEAGSIFIILEEQGEELSLDISWGFPQDYDAMRNRLEHGPGLRDRDHLIIRGALVDEIWTDGTFSSIRQGEADVENNVELIDVAGGLSVASPENNEESFIKLGDIKGE